MISLDQILGSKTLKQTCLAEICNMNLVFLDCNFCFLCWKVSASNAMVGSLGSTEYDYE